MKAKKDFLATKDSKKIIEKAKSEGSISLGEVDKLIPDDATAKDIDSILDTLSNYGITIVQEGKERPGRRRPKTTLRPEEPIRAYFKELAKYDLLTKEEEYELAVKIETGYRMIERQFLPYPCSIYKLIEICKQVENCHRSLDQISRVEIEAMMDKRAFWAERQRFVRRVKSIERDFHRINLPSRRLHLSA